MSEMTPPAYYTKRKQRSSRRKKGATSFTTTVTGESIVDISNIEQKLKMINLLVIG